jgi:hypothetical protein
MTKASLSRFGNLSRLFIAAPLIAAATAAGAVRIVTYNIDCSDRSLVAPSAGFDTVIQAIGNHHIAGNAQPVDVLCLEELDGVQPAPQGNSATLPYITSALNAIYGAGVYAFDPTRDPTDANTTGNGPSGLVYNTHTIQVVAATPIGPAPSSSGAPRQPMRYHLRPVGYGPEADVYLYVSHYKASSGSSNETRRNDEATSIRQDADTLGSSAHIIFAGDYNLTGGSTEPAYQTLIAPGAAKAYDPADSTNSWGNNLTWKRILSESSTSLSARFDFQLVSGATLNQPGFRLAPDTTDAFPTPYAYTVFGNNGNTAFNGSTNTTANTSLSDLANASQVLGLLTTVSDHLPVVADYIVVSSLAAPTGVAASPNPACDGGMTMLSATVPAGQTVDWFTDSCGGTAVGAGASISVVPAAATNYYARARDLASGAVGTACASVSVGVAQSVAITVQPGPVIAAVGRPASFHVGASGTVPMTYQWRWNQTALSDSGRITGSATDTLAINPLQTADAGSYDVVVTDVCGSNTSVAAALRVQLCMADFNGDGILTIQDVFDFLNAWFAGDPRANFDGMNGLQVADIFDFQNAWFAGC